MTDKSSIYISENYTVWGSSDSINKLTDYVDALEEQNTMLVEALEGLVAEMNDVLDSIENEKVHFDGDDFHERLTLANKALAAVKEKP